MANKGYSLPNFCGGYDHFDEKGNKIGSSDPAFLSGYNHYDAKGHKIGHSDPSFLCGYDHYDHRGHKTGHSAPSFSGGYSHYDSKGNHTGNSDPGFLGGYNHTDTGGCYVATCVYGSYDCPEVWTLRRFRDDMLAKTLIGRAFIHAYYAISPTIVKWFGHTDWFRKFWRSHLDNMVSQLRNRGVEDTPYQDKPW